MIYFNPNTQQKEALEDMHKWWVSNDSPQVYELSGRPGTGKTTLCNVFLEENNIKENEYVIVAPTGKAAMQLIRKGNTAQTIHSYFYTQITVPEVDDSGNVVKEHGRVKTKKEFVLKDKEEILCNGLKLCIIDEGGMVGKRIAEDLLSLGLSFLIMGDVDQLPPVLDTRFFLKNPNRHLTQIMRQAEGDPIITISHKLINGERIEFGKYGNSVIVAPIEEIQESILLKPDMILATKNSTRDFINNKIRYELRKRKDDMFHIGDKIICRKNNRSECISESGTELYLVNGMSGIVEDVYMNTMRANTIDIDFRPDFMHTCFYRLEANHEFYRANFKIRNDMKSNFFTSGELFEMGDCITVHLSQGSEWGKILYFMENFGYNKRINNQINYTAVTRAMNSIIIAK